MMESSQTGERKAIKIVIRKENLKPGMMTSGNMTENETNTALTLTEDNDTDSMDSAGLGETIGSQDSESDQYDDLFGANDNVSQDSKTQDVDSSATKDGQKQTMFYETFTDLNELEDHVRMHGKGITKCYLCHDEFDNKSVLIEHMKTAHSSQDILSCGLCAAVVDTHSDLGMHSKEEHAFDGYRCGICGKFYQTQFDLQRHEEQHVNDSDKTVFQCIYCSDSFPNSRDLFQHSKDVHNICRFICGICRLFYQSDRDFLEHRATHSANECSLFPVMIEQEQPGKRKLTEKEIENTKKKEEQFTKQVQDFNQYLALQRIYSQVKQHDLNVHDTDYGKPLICAVCGERFSKNATLAVHSKLAHGLLGFDCEQCQTFFQIESEAVQHISVHGNVINALTKEKVSKNAKIQKIKSENGSEEFSYVGENKSAHDTDLDFTETTQIMADNMPVPSSLHVGSSSLDVAGLSNELALNNNEIQSQADQIQSEKTDTLCVSQGISLDILTDTDSDNANSEIVDLQYEPKVDSDLEVPEVHDLSETGAESSQDKTKQTSSQRNSKQCQYCGKVFNSKNSRETHEIREHTHDYYVCKVCDKKLCNATSYGVHMKAHSMPAEVHTCEICGKTFPYKNSLFTHKICIHTSAKPHICAYCGMAFKLEKSMKTHERKHNGIGFSCNVCGENFKTTSARKIHIQDVHTGRPVECKTCGKLFRSNRSLHEHELTHTGEKPHKCPMCDARFRRPHHVTQHLQRHYKGTA